MGQPPFEPLSAVLECYNHKSEESICCQPTLSLLMAAILHKAYLTVTIVGTVFGQCVRSLRDRNSLMTLPTWSLHGSSNLAPAFHLAVRIFTPGSFKTNSGLFAPLVLGFVSVGRCESSQSSSGVERTSPRLVSVHFQADSAVVYTALLSVQKVIQGWCFHEVIALIKTNTLWTNTITFVPLMKYTPLEIIMQPVETGVKCLVWLSVAFWSLRKQQGSLETTNRIPDLQTEDAEFERGWNLPGRSNERRRWGERWER